MRKTVVFGSLASALAVATIAAVAPRAFAQEVAWRNDWTVAAPLPYRPYLLPPIQETVIAADGDLLLAATPDTGYGHRLSRIDASGRLRWSVDADGFQAAPVTTIGQSLPEPDGGAFAVLTTYGSFVGHIDPAGALVWTRAVPAHWLVDMSSGQVATSDCGVISVLDGTRGDVLWQHQMTASNAYCTAGGISVDAQGDLYASFTRFSATSATDGFRLAKFDADGNVLWNTAVAGTSSATLVGPGPVAAFVYAYDNASLYAVRVGDGSIAWSVPIEHGTTVLLSPDATAEPVLVGSASVQRLSAGTGQSLWTQAVDYPTTSAIVGDAVVVQSSAGLLKLDAVGGDVLWTGALPPTDTFGNPLVYTAFGGLASGQFLAVAYSQDYDTLQPPFLQRVAFDSGQPTAQVAAPSTVLGLSGTSIQEDADHVIGVSVGQGSDSTGLRLRRLSAVDGSLLWEQTEPVYDYFRAQTQNAGVAVAGDAAAAAFVQNSGSVGQANNLSLVWVGLYDRATGERRWGVALPGLFQESTTISTPVADVDGNVVLAVGTFMSCGQLMCAHQQIYKLAASDGTLLWSTDSVVFGTTQALPQIFAVQGDDVLVSGPFSGALDGASVARLSGADGSVLWTSDAVGPYGGNIYPADDGTIVVLGNGWARLDGSTGSTLWAFPESAMTCAPNCPNYYTAMLPSGDVIGGASDGAQALLVRYRGDGSGIVDSWHLGSSGPGLRSWVSAVEVDPQGQIWVRVHSGFEGLFDRIAFLGRFDVATGTLQSEQAFDSFMSDPLAGALEADLLGAPIGNRLLVATEALQAPTPVTTGNAAIDTTVQANGDLSMQLSFDRTQAVPGDRIAIHVIAAYTGDAPISGARLFARLPWPVDGQSLTCSASSAGQCVIDSTSGNLRASFDLSPGDAIQIDGQMQVLDAEPATDPASYGFVVGPTALNETDTSNNFATAPPVTQSLFFDGFEQRSPAH